MPSCPLMSYYHGSHDHPARRDGAIALAQALEWVLLLSFPTIRGCWFPVCCWQEEFHQLYFHQHTDFNAQQYTKGLPRHTPVVVHYPILAHVRVERFFGCSREFLSLHIIKEGLCENHFQAIVIPEPMMFRRHHTMLRCPFNHYGTEVSFLPKIK